LDDPGVIVQRGDGGSPSLSRASEPHQPTSKSL